MNKRRSIVLLLALVLIVGCATTGTPPPNSVPLTPLDKAKLQAISFLERYKFQVKDAFALEKLIKEGRATSGQIEVYRLKRKLLIEVEPLVLTFDALVDKGTVPGLDKEQEINDILNRLLSVSSNLGG